jgi:hypothetical protein
MDSYNSIIYGNFLQPITYAVYNLVRQDRESVDWKTNEGDLDWILSGTLLTVAMLECALRWTHVHRHTKSSEEGLYLYEELRAANSTALPDVREIFVLRNAIAHGHVWDVSIPKSPIARVIANVLRAKQDKLFKKCVDPTTQLTPSGLHVIPTLMSRQDFKSVLQITVEAFSGLIALDCLLPQALKNVAIWPDGRGDRLTLADLPGRI